MISKLGSQYHRRTVRIAACFICELAKLCRAFRPRSKKMGGEGLASSSWCRRCEVGGFWDLGSGCHLSPLP
ncbi:hypothetical protein RYX36_009790 [Vicia faba]